MRVIAAEEITKNVREMCIEANVNLSEDMEKAIRDSVESEDSPLGKQILLPSKILLLTRHTNIRNISHMTPPLLASNTFLINLIIASCFKNTKTLH